jgi:hypothetical protein
MTGQSSDADPGTAPGPQAAWLALGFLLLSLFALLVTPLLVQRVGGEAGGCGGEPGGGASLRGGAA